MYLNVRRKYVFANDQCRKVNRLTPAESVFNTYTQSQFFIKTYIEYEMCVWWFFFEFLIAFWEEVLVLSFIKWKQHVSNWKKIHRINMFSWKYFVMQIDPLCYCESKDEFTICNFHSIFLFAHWLMLKWNYYGIKLAQIIWWDKNRNLVRIWKYPIVPNN